MNAVDMLGYGHKTVEKAVDGLADEHWTRPDAVGYWSVKDIIAHLASFEGVLVEVLCFILEGTPIPIVERFAANPAVFNDVEVDEKRAGLSPRQAWDEYVSTYEQAIELLAKIPVEERRRLGAVPYYGDAYDLEDYLVYSFYAHKREHCAQIGVLRDRIKAEAVGSIPD